MRMKTIKTIGLGLTMIILAVITIAALSPSAMAQADPDHVIAYTGSAYALRLTLIGLLSIATGAALLGLERRPRHSALK